MLREFFGKVVREQRLQKGLTQEKLAELADLDRAYIYHLEHGKKEPSLTTIFKIAKGLNIKPGELIERIDKMNDCGV